MSDGPPESAVQVVDGVEYHVEGRACTAEEEFFLKLDEEGIRQLVPRLNDALTRMLTLTTALAGGTLALLKDDVCTGWGRVAAALCFFAALLAAAYGTIPYQRAYRRDPAEVVAALDAARRHKRRLLFAALGASAAGLLVAIAGAAVRAFG